MLETSPYLNFNGNCAEAFRFYEQVLGGKLEAVIPFAGTPMEQHVPPESRDKTLHARLKVGNQAIMGSDAQSGEFKGVHGCAVSISVDKVADAERIFGALSEGGKVGMPLQQTFWAVRFGMLVDRFGIPWMVNCEKES